MRVLLPVCLFLIALAAAAPALGYDVPPYLILAGGFNHPMDIAYDVWNDVVLVADYGNSIIKKYRIDTSSGAVVYSLGYAFRPDAYKTNAVEVTNIGYSYYVAQSSIYRVPLFPHFESKIYSYPGTAETEFYPRSFTVDEGGNLYIADERSQRIQKRAITGQFIANWTADTIGAGSFTPFDIEFDPDGNLLVSDTGNHRILRLSPDGGYLGEFGSFGTGDGEFDTPRGIGIDWLGNIYVCDWGNDRIQVFDGAGTFIAAWGEPGLEHGQFNAPQEVAFDIRHGLLFVLEEGNKRFQVFQLDASSLPPLPTPPDPPDPPVPPDPREPAIVLHVAPAGPGTSCSSVPDTLEQMVTAAPVTEEGIDYIVYIIGVPEILETTDPWNPAASPGLGGIQLGIVHEDNPALDVSAWTSCSSLEFPAPEWPATGSGNTMTWISGCDEALMVAGYLSVTAYGPSTLSIAPFPATDKIKTADCSAAETVLDHNLGVDRAGWVSFGGGSRGLDTDGCNPILTPCAEITAVERTTWGRLKTMFGGEGRN